MTAPDNDVRPWRRPTPPKAGGAGRFALARLLLHVLNHLRQLDRKLLLLLAASSLSACIIPVGPEFQDPLGVPNSPPQILNPVPTWGAEVAAGPQGATFIITATDTNLTDELSIRFLVDGVPAGINHTRFAATGSPVRQPVSNAIACEFVPEGKKTLSRHDVLAVVADREFVVGGSELLIAEPPGLVSSPVTWTLIINCQMSPGSPQ